MRRSALERLEELATEVLGRGAAIEVRADRFVGLVVLVWPPKGDTCAVRGEGATRAEAIGAASRQLKAIKRILGGEVTP